MRFSTPLTIIVLILSAASTKAAVTRYYRFETNNGAAVSNGQTLTSADDSSGNNLAGVPVGTPTYATTPFISPILGTGVANQFSLLGGTGKGVFLSGATAPVIATVFTVEAFFRLSSTDPNTGDVKKILTVRDGAGFSVELGVLNLNGNGGTNDLLFEMSDDTLELRRFDLSANTNYHLAATYDGTTASLYLDGTLVDSANFQGFTGSGTTQAGIGYDPLVPGSSYFQGNIDEVRISDVALSPAQFLNVVPEPTTLPLLALGVIGTICIRRVRLVGINGISCTD